MGSRDSRVDAYIAMAAPFARPILVYLRTVVHAGCPAVVETIKWGHPHFERRGVLCSMAAFKAHCAFEFRHGKVAGGAGGEPGKAMSRFGRITRLSDLPKDTELKALVKKVAAANAAGVQSARGANPDGPPPIAVPEDSRAVPVPNASEAALDASGAALENSRVSVEGNDPPN